jgi:PAS domain S-box-containing protein
MTSPADSVRAPRNLRDLGIVAVVALAYFAAARLGLSLAFSIKQVTALWPPAGIALAALLLGGYRVWPAICLAAFAVNVLVGNSLWVAAGIAAGNTIGPLVARYALGRLRDFDPGLPRVRDVLGLIVLGAMPGAAICATNGAAMLALAAVIPWPAYGSVWRVWWAGDAMGVLVFAPLILSWAAQPRPLWGMAARAELIVLFGGLLLTSLMAVAGFSVHTATAFQLQYAVFPFIIWAGLRFGMRETGLAVALVTGLAVWGAIHDRGPFAIGNLDQRLILLEIFMAAVTVTGLILSAVKAERVRAERALQSANEELGERFAARTAELLGRVGAFVGSQERLRESEERFRSAFEFAAIGMALVAPEGRWLRVNRSLCRLVGYTAEELMATDFQTITHPDDLRTGGDYMRQTLDGSLSHYTMEQRYLHKDGHILWVLLTVSLVRDAKDQPLYFVSQIQDITEQRRLTDDLRLARTDLQAILDNVPARITAWHADWTNRFVNRLAAAQFGFPAQAAVGKPAREIIGEERYRIAQPYMAAVLSGKQQSYEQVDVQWDGSKRYSYVKFVPSFKDGRVNALYALGTDVTELRESHQRTRELAQRLETVCEDERRSIAQVLHEGIAQDLFAMKLNLERLQAQPTARAAVIQVRQELAEAIEHCMFDTRQIAQELRPSALGHLPVSVALKEHARYFGGISGLSIRMVESAPIPALDEATALTLFRSAQEALKNVARHARAMTVHIFLHADPTSVIMDIIDDGTGIPDDALAKAGAFGLLGIRERVGALGGTLAVRKNDGAGTTVRVHIPHSRYIPQAGDPQRLFQAKPVAKVIGPRTGKIRG